MASDEGPLETAFCVLYGLCVPAVSDGEVRQTISDEFIVPLTEAERTAYAGVIQGAPSRLLTDDGFFLVMDLGDSCAVAAMIEDARAVPERFAHWAGASGCHLLGAEQRDEAEILSAALALSAERLVLIQVTISTAEGPGPFYGAAKFYTRGAEPAG